MRLSGADVHLVVPRRRNAITKNPREFYGLKTDLPVQYLPVLDLYSWGGLGYAISGFTFLIAYWFFLAWKKLRGGKFVLYTIDMDEFSFIGVSLLGVPFAMEIHGAKRYGALLNRTLKGARAVLTINSIVQRSLVETFKLPPEKVLAHPNGIDVSMFSQPVDRNAWRAKWGIAPDARLVLYVGRCYPWKGMDVLDRASRLLPDVAFAFVGCTRKEFETVTGTPCGYGNVLFFGERPYAEMPEWMKSADILLVLGTKKNEYSYRQTSPMKLFEYMATGVPILAADTPAIRDVVSPEEVLFYEPDNAAGLARAMRDILGNRPRAERAALRAAQSARARSWERRAESILAKLPTA